VKDVTQEVPGLVQPVFDVPLPARQGEDDRGQSATSVLLARIAFGIALLLAWQGLAHVVGTYWISQPTDVAAKLVAWIKDGTLARALGITLFEALSGFLIGASAATVVGLLLGRLPRIAVVLDPYINAVYSLPKIALAPLFILWFGIDIKPKIALAAVTVFFLVFYSTYSGVRDVDVKLIEQIQLMGAKRWHLYRFVIIPSALTWIMVGLKLSVPYALIGAVVMEIVSSNRGIGYLISSAASQFDTSGVFAALVVLMLLAMVLHGAIVRAEEYFLRWKR
jgi:NitT/TauT family transport system permease protein